MCFCFIFMSRNALGQKAAEQTETGTTRARAFRACTCDLIASSSRPLQLACEERPRAAWRVFRQNSSKELNCMYLYDPRPLAESESECKMSFVLATSPCALFGKLPPVDFCEFICIYNINCVALLSDNTRYYYI